MLWDSGLSAGSSRPLCLMEERGPWVRPPGSLERRDGGGVCSG